MEFYDNIVGFTVENSCNCDDHCSSDSWGCDNDNVCGTDTDD